MLQLILFVLLFHFETLAQGTKDPSTETNIPDGLVMLSREGHFSQHAFIVDKSKRTLSVYENKNGKLNLISEYPADIGKKDGPKTKENDLKTPVGIYFLQKELTQPEIPFDLYGSLAFTTDYPNIFDKRDYKTGYGIWLHAVPDTIPLTRGSRGCVVVRDDVIKNLKSYVRHYQTPILIYDQVNYVNESQHLENKKNFLQHIEDWRLAWQNHDVDTYIKYYDDTFRNDQMNFRQWYRHKKKLKKIYSYIKVELSEPLILRNEDQVVLRMIQRYESDLHKDYGIKTIHARWSPDVGFKIIREDWSPLIDPMAEDSDPKKEQLEPQAALVTDPF